jgi:hypothetical protein
VCLFDIPRDAIEDKDVTCWAIAVCANHCIDGDTPKFYSSVIGHEEALARIVDENLTKLGGHVEVAEDISTSEVNESRDCAKGFTQSSFATTRCSKEQNCLKFRATVHPLPL